MEGKSVISSLVTTTLALLTILGTYKMVNFFIKWGKEEGGLASQQQTVLPAPGLLSDIDDILLSYLSDYCRNNLVSAFYLVVNDSQVSIQLLYCVLWVEANIVCCKV